MSDLGTYSEFLERRDLERRWNDVDPREEALHGESLPRDIDYRDRDVVPLDWDADDPEPDEGE